MEGVMERASEEDLAEILALQKEAFLSVALFEDNMLLPPMVQTQADIAGEYQEKHFIKYTVGGRIVGSVRAHVDGEGVCHIGRLIVHPDHQGEGIGKALMREIEGIYHTCSVYELFTGSHIKKNIAFYKNLGYAETEEREEDGVALVYLRKANR